MPFSWPSLPDIAYRLWRLKRLIAVATVLPLVFFAAMAFIGLGTIGTGPWGLAAPAAAVVLIVAAHAVIFPNSNQETLAISLTLAILALVAPLISGSLFGWFLFAIFALWMIWSGQQRILFWQSSTSTHSPTFTARVRTTTPLEKARYWFPLRPGLKRGHFRCGEAGPDGSFPVWYDTGSADWLSAFGLDEGMPREMTEELEQDMPPSFYARIAKDAPDYQKTLLLQGESMDDDAVMSVVEHWFKPRGEGCVVTESDSATSFPRGQSLGIWLADFAVDGLILNRDLLEGRETKAIRGTHHMSLLGLLSGWILKKFMMRGRGADGFRKETAATSGAAHEMDGEKLSALLRRLGPDYQTDGYTRGPMPLVTLEEFFDGNNDDGSFQGASVEVARRALEALREREDVADIRLGVTQWDGLSTWPLAEYVYFVTSAKLDDVRKWLKEANIWVDEVDTENEHHRREEIAVPPGHRVVWAWID